MKRTPLYETHKKLNARMVPFGGWEMPVQYGGIRAEHLAVRKEVGMFDVSHMGEIEVSGPHAEDFLHKVSCNDITKLAEGQCQYSGLLNHDGGFIDDIIINKIHASKFIVCVNASNTEKDFQWLQQFSMSAMELADRSDAYFQIAVQGPAASKIMQQIFPDLTLPNRFHLVSEKKNNLMISRTGYTGEDGFEIYGPPEKSGALWQALLEKGVVPCGLAARDSLRIEAGYPLFGHEISGSITPHEAGLSWIVRKTPTDFIGKEALKKPVSRKLAGLVLQEPGIAREGYPVFSASDENKRIGFITSGTKSPWSDQSIAMALLEKDFAGEKTKIKIDIHNKKREAIVVSLPFK